MGTIQIALPLVTSFYYLVVYSPNGSKIYFFNGDLREEIHIAQPPSFVKDGTYKRICGLKKYLYGMKQAPGLGMRKLINSLFSDFSCCHSDSNLYVKHVNGDILILFFM
jgi:hypothetical protein